MGIFGWDLPPGCSVRDLPGYDDCAVSLDARVPALRPGQAAYWTDDGDVLLDEQVVGHVEWDDQLSDEVNEARAAALVQRYLEKLAAAKETRDGHG